MKNIQQKIKNKINEFYSDCKLIKTYGIKDFLKKRKYEVITIFAFIMFLIITPLIWNVSESKDSIIKNFQIGVEQNNGKKIKKYMLVDGKRISEIDVSPIINYYSQHNDELIKIIDELKKDGEAGLFNIVEEKGVLKDKYYINIKSLTIKFKIPTESINLSLNNKEIVATKVQKGIIPGTYNINYSIKTEYGDVNGEKKIDLFQDQEVVVDSNVVNITLYTNFPDAKVFINNKELEFTADQINNYGPIPTDKDLELYISKEFPWGNIESEKVKISKDNYIKLDINMANDIVTNEIYTLTNSFYEEAFEALNDKDINLITKGSEEAREKIYNYIEEKALIFTNNYQITDLNVEIEKSEFKFNEGEYTASIYTNINYSVYKKLAPFIKSGNEGKFLLSLKFDNNNWNIEDIQKFKDEQ